MNGLLNYLHYHGFNIFINYNHESDYFELTARKEGYVIQVVGSIILDKKWEITVSKKYSIKGYNCSIDSWEKLFDNEVGE